MSRRSRLMIIALLVLTAAVIVYALFFMGREVETSHVSLPTPGQTDGAQQSGPPGDKELELTAENVCAVLAELDRAESYSCTVTVEDFWPGGSSEQELQVWVSSGRTRIRGELGGGTRNLLLSGGTLYVWYDSVSGVAELPYGGASDAWLRSITYEDVLSLPEGSVTGAGYEQYGGTECIMCLYTDPLSALENRLYVSASTGLLMGAESRDGSSLVYRMSVSGLQLAEPDGALFDPPDA